VKKAMVQQLHQKFNLTTFDDGETIEDYALRLSGMAAHLTTLGKEVKDGEIITKMLRSLPPRFKQIMIVIKTLLDVSTMSVADLIGRLKEVEEAFEEAPTSLQQDGKLYLTEEEWDMQRKKREAGNHSGSSTRGGGAGKGHGRGRGHGGYSSSGSSIKPTGDECRRCDKMGHWARECHSKPKMEQAHVAQDEEEASLMLASVTLIRPEVISSNIEVEIHEEKVFDHLDKEKERDAGTWVLDTGVKNHMSRCQAAFTKIDTVGSILCVSVMTQWHGSRAAGLSCSCARTASPHPSTGSTSSLV
jgi:hypothetical protein